MNLYQSEGTSAAGNCNCINNPQSLAIATVPFQKWNKTYDYETALSVGTIFPDLHMPFFMGGDSDGK